MSRPDDDDEAAGAELDVEARSCFSSERDALGAGANGRDELEDAAAIAPFDASFALRGVGARATGGADVDFFGGGDAGGDIFTSSSALASGDEYPSDACMRAAASISVGLHTRCGAAARYRSTASIRSRCMTITEDDDDGARVFDAITRTCLHIDASNFPGGSSNLCSSPCPSICEYTTSTPIASSDVNSSRSRSNVSKLACDHVIDETASVTSDGVIPDRSSVPGGMTSAACDDAEFTSGICGVFIAVSLIPAAGMPSMRADRASGD